MSSSNAKKRRGDRESAHQIEAGPPRVTKKAPENASISRLGWSRAKAAEVRASLRAFDEDWNAPGMEAYDRL
jgi:hypothetical protein